MRPMHLRSVLPRASPATRFVAPKTIEQQEMQSVERIREHISDDLTATSNMIRALLGEFGLEIPKGKAPSSDTWWNCWKMPRTTFQWCCALN